MSEKKEAMDSLRRGSESVVFLISSSYAVNIFPIKWRAIREKLEQLNSILTAATDTDPSCNSSELKEISQAITSTANEAAALVERCCNESFNGGKLLMKSDIELFASKIDQHIKDLNAFYASGKLMNSGGAIVVSKPSIGSCREDMRFYVKDVFSRLKIGSAVMKTRALVAINEILQEDEKYARIIALETGDSINLLVNLLEFGDAGVVEQAAEAVSVIARFDSYKPILVSAGVMAALVRVIETGSNSAKEKAAKALKQMTENSDNSWSVSAHGGVTTLVKILSDESVSNTLVVSACRVLRNLSNVDEIRRFMVEQGLVSILVKLFKSQKEANQLQAIEFLLCLANEDESIRQKAIKEGIVEVLVNILNPNCTYSSKAREIVLRAIENLFSSSNNELNLLISIGFLESLLYFLKNGEMSLQESAVKVIVRLCSNSDETKKVMGDIGFMPELVRLLDAKSFEVREMAAETLCSLLSVQKNRRKFIQEEHNVNQVLRLLNLEDEKFTMKKSLLPVIMCLTSSNSGRRKITASGYIENLEKLAETGVTDAKKIVKKLSASRFRNIFNGIW